MEAHFMIIESNGTSFLLFLRDTFSSSHSHLYRWSNSRVSSALLTRLLNIAQPQFNEKKLRCAREKKVPLRSRPFHHKAPGFDRFRGDQPIRLERLVFLICMKCGLLPICASSAGGNSEYL